MKLVHYTVGLASCITVSLSAQVSGYLDAGFGSGGMTTGTLPDKDGAGVIAVDPTGAGYFLFGGHDNGACTAFPVQYFLIKYMSSGQLDNSFNGGSPVYITDMQCGLEVPVEASLTVQADGKPVVTGMSPGLALPKLRVRRFLPNGQPDATFGTGGLFEFSSGSSYHTGLSVAQDSNGRIVCCGFYNASLVDQERHALVLRLLSNGTLDPSFGGGDGWAVYDQLDNPGPAYEDARIPYPLTSGDLLVGGYFHEEDENTYLYVMRLDAGGSLVSTFATNGIFTTGSSVEEYLTAMDVDQTDGYIHLGIWDDAQGNSDLVVDRIDLNTGTYVGSFGTNGRARKDIAGASGKDILQALVRDASGNIYVGGWLTGASDTSAVVCRFSNTGTWDATWLGDGVDITSTHAVIDGMLRTTDGLVVIGERNSPGDYFIARYGNYLLRIDDNTSERPFVVSPNPTEGLVTILQGPSHRVDMMTITDGSGRNVLSPALMNTTGIMQLDMSNLEAGLYFIRVVAGGRSSVERVVKK